MTTTTTTMIMIMIMIMIMHDYDHDDNIYVNDGNDDTNGGGGGGSGWGLGFGFLSFLPPPNVNELGHQPHQLVLGPGGWQIRNILKQEAAKSSELGWLTTRPQDL